MERRTFWFVLVSMVALVVDAYSADARNHSAGAQSNAPVEDPGRGCGLPPARIRV